MPCPSETLDALINSARAAIAARSGTASTPQVNRQIAPKPYVWGEVLDLSSSGQASRYLGSGWCIPEPAFCWTEGPLAEFHLPLQSHAGVDVVLTAVLDPLLSDKTPAQPVRIHVNDNFVGQWHVRRPGPQHVVIFQRHLAEKERLSLQFELPSAFSPQSQGLSPDPRVLALAFRSLVLSPVAPG